MAYVIYGDDGSTLAYVDGEHFIIDNINLKDVNTGNNIANLYRDRFTATEWTWTITVYDLNHPVADPVLLSLIAGQRSFGSDPNSTDMCNNYFTVVGWLLVAILGLAALIIIYVLYHGFRQGMGLCCFCRRSSSDAYSAIQP